MRLKVKFILLFVLWLAGTILLWTSNHKIPLIIIISGAILIRSFVIERKKIGDKKDKVPTKPSKQADQG